MTKAENSENQLPRNPIFSAGFTAKNTKNYAKHKKRLALLKKSV